MLPKNSCSTVNPASGNVETSFSHMALVKNRTVYVGEARALEVVDDVYDDQEAWHIYYYAICLLDYECLP